MENTIKQAEPDSFDFSAVGDCCMKVTGAPWHPFRDGDVAFIRLEPLQAHHEQAASVVICQEGRAIMGQMTVTKAGQPLLALPGVGLIPFEPADFMGPVVGLWRSLEPTTDEERCSSMTNQREAYRAGFNRALDLMLDYICLIIPYREGTATQADLDRAIDRLFAERGALRNTPTAEAHAP